MLSPTQATCVGTRCCADAGAAVRVSTAAASTSPADALLSITAGSLLLLVPGVEALVDLEGDLVEQRGGALPSRAAPAEAADHAQPEGARAPGHDDRQLPLQRRGVELPLAGHDGVRAAARGVEAQHIEHLRAAVDQLRPERAELRAEAARRSG